MSEPAITTDYVTHALLAGVLLVETELIRREKDRDARRRMERVRDIHLQSWSNQWPELATIHDGENTMRRQMCEWPKERALEWLIVLVGSVPFAPYEPAELDDEDYAMALATIAPIVNLSVRHVDTVFDARDEVLKQLKSSSFAKKLGRAVLKYGLLASSVLVPVAAPLGLAVTSGLSGAAAMSSALAALGGGAVASGGLGMLGGITTVGIGGIVLGSGGTLALRASNHPVSVDEALIRNDLAQRMIFWRVVLLHHLHDRQRARTLIETFHDEAKALRVALDELRIYNDPKSDLIEEAEDRIKTFNRAIKWMEEELEAFLSDD